MCLFRIFWNTKLEKRKKYPAYLRIGKSGEKNFTKRANQKWKIGIPRRIIKGKSICLIATGPVIKFFFEIIDDLKKKNIFASVYSFHTLKPIDKRNLKIFFKKYEVIVTLEDSTEINGLASIFRENAFLNNYNGRIISFSLKDKHLKNYGSQNDLLFSHGISPIIIYKKIIKNYQS